MKLILRNILYTIFQEAVHSQIYVDKTEFLRFTNKKLNTQQKFICISRPRRFGKSMTANMICAYYNHTVEGGDVKSVVDAMLSQEFGSYWNRTETYEALQIYIDLNEDGLRDAIVKMMGGGRQKIDTGTFQNDMTTFHSADDVMTLLVHLGYLGYDSEREEVFIPNNEVMREYVNAVNEDGGKLWLVGINYDKKTKKHQCRIEIESK